MEPVAVVTHAPQSSSSSSSSPQAVNNSCSGGTKRPSSTASVAVLEVVSSSSSTSTGSTTLNQQQRGSKHQNGNNNAHQQSTPQSEANIIKLSSVASSNNNPIFVITSSSNSGGGGGDVAGICAVTKTSSVGGTCSSPSSSITPSSTSTSNKHSSSSNTSDMPSNSCGGGDAAVSSTSSAVPVVSAQFVELEDDGGSEGNKEEIAPPAIPSGHSISSPSSSAGSGRTSNPRQSTLTRSHAITLDEDSDGQGGGEPGFMEDIPHQEQEQELIHFLIDTCNKSPKDKNFVLRIEADLVQFVKDETRLTLPFPQMSSYQRMLVHRMATLFDLDHNVDTSSGGNFVVVSKDLNGGGSHGRGRLPPIRFKELQTPTASSHMDGSNSSSGEPAVPTQPELYASNNTLSNSVPATASAASAAASIASSKKILKREKPSGSQAGDKKGSGATKAKSLEERTQDYHKARRRIFEDCGGGGVGGESTSLDTPNSVTSASTSSKKLNWSSTDSSEDRMYLKPPFPSSTGSGGKLMKVESFESASQKKPSNRDSRQMGKSHSFGGYEDSQQQQQHQPHHHHHYAGGRNRGGGNSNNASSSMISCSSSSSLRSSSFSKQDSSSSTTSGSGQSPSGGTSSGYKSGSSGILSGGSTVPLAAVSGYYSSGSGASSSLGISPNGTAPMSTNVIPPPPPPPIALQQPPTHNHPPAGAIIFAPASAASHHSQIFQTTAGVVPMPQQSVFNPSGGGAEDPSSPSHPQNPNQQVMFCCWAVADVNNVPPGAVIIDPTTGQAVKNTDGSQYFYDPINPPKFVQTVPMVAQQQPPPSSTPQHQQQQAPPSHQVSTPDPYSTSTASLYPPFLAGPPITTYAPVQQHSQQCQPTQIVASPSGATSHQHSTAYMTVPAAATYFPAVGGVPSSLQESHQQQFQDLSGYFSQLSLGMGSTAGAMTGGRQAPPTQVIYVPVDALNSSTTYATPLTAPPQNLQDQPSPPQQQQAQVLFYEVDAQGLPTQPAAVQYQPTASTGVQGTGYLIQQVVDATGGGSSLYYYGGNLVQPPSSILPSAGGPSSSSTSACAGTSNNGNTAIHSQPHQHLQQHPPSHHQMVSQQQQPVFSLHHSHHSHQGTSSHQGSQQPQGARQSTLGGTSAIMIHSNAPSQAGLMSVIPGGPHHSQQPQHAQTSSQQSLVPLGYHPGGGPAAAARVAPNQHHHHQGSASQQFQQQSLMPTLVPVQSSMYPPSQPPPPPSSAYQPHYPLQSSSSHHQSFVQASPQQQLQSHPPPHHHANQNLHHPAPHNLHHRQHSSSSSTSTSHASHHHNNHSSNPQQHPPRYLTLSSSTAAAAAAASQHQQQILFAAAAAAMAMSNNYSGFPTSGIPASVSSTTGVSTRFVKGGGGRGGILQHASVTGAHVRRGGGVGGPRSFSKQSQQQQPNSSK